MTNLTENSVWESGVFQLEVDTPTLGGPPGFDMGEPVTGHANAQAQQLANRTKYLKDTHETFVSDLADATDPAKGAGMVGFRQDGAGAIARTMLDKAREMVSAEDFGVKFDGVIDNAPALQTAIDYAAAKKMALRVGNCRIASNVFVKSYSVIHFDGVQYGDNARRLKIQDNATNFYVAGFNGESCGIEVPYSASNGVIYNPKINGQAIWYRAGFRTGPTSVHLVNPEVTTTGDGYYFEAMNGCVIQNPLANGCAIRFLAGRRNLIYRPRVTGKPVVGINMLSRYDLTSYLGHVDNTIFEPVVEDFSEEGISFDCAGNLASTVSTRLSTTVQSVVGNIITTAVNTASAFAAVNMFAVFQTGRLAGRAYTVTYQGADGLGGWTLGDGFSGVSTQASAGDIVTLEIPCRGNKVINPCVYGSTSRSGIYLYGHGRETEIINPRFKNCDIVVRSLRGLINSSYDYSVPHFARIVGGYSQDGDVIQDTLTYSGFEKPYNIGLALIDVRARKLQRVRGCGAVIVNNQFIDKKETECFFPGNAYIPSQVFDSCKGKKVVAEQIALDATTTQVVRIPVKQSAFMSRVRFSVSVTPSDHSGYVGRSKTFELIVRRVNETVSTLTVGTPVQVTDINVPSKNGGVFSLTDFSVTTAISGSTAINATDAEIVLSITVTGAGSGVSAGVFKWLVRMDVDVAEMY